MSYPRSLPKTVAIRSHEASDERRILRSTYSRRDPHAVIIVTCSEPSLPLALPVGPGSQPSRSLLRLRHKPIAYSPHRLQVLGLRRILFNVPPEPHHKIIDGAGVGIFAQSPHIF
jgi:hypothetical protein